MNKLGSLLFRITNIGFLTLGNLLFSLLLGVETFGTLYTLIAGVALVTSLFDIINMKYMVHIFSKNFELWPDIIYARFWTALMAGGFGFIALILLGTEPIVAIITGALIVFMLFNSGLLTLFYCWPQQQYQIFISSILGMSVFIGVGMFFLRPDMTVPTALILLVAYKLGEAIWLLSRLKVSYAIVLPSASKVYKTFCQFPRRAFYLQNLLSVGSGRLHALVLPILLIPTEFGTLGQFATVMAIYIFVMTYLGTDFFREASKDGLKGANWRRYVMLLTIAFLGFIALVLSALPTFYPELQPFIGLMLLQALVLTFSTQQGYIMFLLDLDRWIIILSVVTPVFAIIFLFLFTTQLGLIGAFVAMILIELVSVVMAFAIILYQRRAIT